MLREEIRVAYEDACCREIEALKPGNVHAFSDGHGMTSDQFITSARVSSGPLTDPALPLGDRILEAVRVTREAVATNTNLGILLLAGPLARAAEMPGGTLRGNVETILQAVGPEDTRPVFEAIALASPGGLGAAENDVREAPKVTLLQAMREASDRDLIARQYAGGFEDVFDTGVKALDAALSRGESDMWPAVFAYMAFFSKFADSHVARKHGDQIANLLREEAAAINSTLHATPDEAARLHLLVTFDRQLKARKINPGTSADLTVASLFAHSLVTILHKATDGD
jgi:triphosphoribosyl-dephospho-CoA synthase